MNEPENFEAFEDQVRRALQRVDAPDGFADRVAGRAERNSRVVEMRPRAWPRSRCLGSAIAAMLALGVFAGEQVHVRRQQKAALVQQQFETAMRVTDQALEQTKEQLDRAGVSLDGR